jgi:SAM-dependent methyltransferase
MESAQSIRELVKRLTFRIPFELKQRQIADTKERLEQVRGALTRHYFQGWRAPNTMSPTAYATDLNDHLVYRLNQDRMRIIPWLNAAARLDGLRILEIGCGSGASTVALAEQGANVIGIDIDEDALEVARARSAAYGVSAEFRAANAVDVLKELPNGQINLILFFACLEHMTHEERLESLRLAWERLPPNGMLAVVDTPNRLWCFDGHTSLLPFFHWLSDELAFDYARCSPREVFNRSYSDKSSQMEHFLRRGRGVSFHEFELAIGPPKALRIVSSIFDFHRLAGFLRQSRLDRLCTKLLRFAYPRIHPAWCHASLDLILSKDH